ncbi:hypothetical protein DBR45_12780 [Pseudomonas sp. HMWF031]|nr:hypothetical protein DBR45_12780 [Pseudomonas sp. HMWF031]
MADWPWEALSTIGTLAAVGVALWFSVQSVRASGKAEEDRAQLAAAKMLSPLSSLERKASFLYTWFAFSEVSTFNLYDNVKKALEELEALSRSVSNDDLYPLLKLPNHAAKRSSRALGLIQTFVADASATLNHHSWNDLDIDQKNIHHKRWLAMVSEIKDHLTLAVTVCDKAAATGAPRPSAEEIYGQFPEP